MRSAALVGGKGGGRLVRLWGALLSSLEMMQVPPPLTDGTAAVVLLYVAVAM